MPALRFTRLTKRGIERAFVTIHDAALNRAIRQAKQVQVLINYSVGTKRLEKRPDEFDDAVLSIIDSQRPQGWFPTAEMPTVLTPNSQRCHTASPTCITFIQSEPFRSLCS